MTREQVYLSTDEQIVLRRLAYLGYLGGDPPGACAENVAETLQERGFVYKLRNSATDCSQNKLTLRGRRKAMQIGGGITSSTVDALSSEGTSGYWDRGYSEMRSPYMTTRIRGFFGLIGSTTWANSGWRRKVNRWWVYLTCRHRNCQIYRWTQRVAVDQESDGSIKPIAIGGNTTIEIRACARCGKVLTVIDIDPYRKIEKQRYRDGRRYAKHESQTD